MLVCLAACGAHLGRPPVALRVARVEVVARAAEPGLPAALESAVRRALVERGAWGEDGSALVLEVVQAGWGDWVTGGTAPTREVVLIVRARGTGGTDDVTVRRVVPVGVSSAEGAAVRAEALARLAAEAAEVLVARGSVPPG
ncbi:MAG: hypothetical protein RLZZ299_2354 [Pseudomonadota bacterium]